MKMSRPECPARSSRLDLVRLDRYQIALRLAVQGVSTRAFTATTLAPHSNIESYQATVRRISRDRYARKVYSDKEL